MKILVVCQYYSPEPFRISDICESLVDRGHKITVLTGLPNYPEGKILDGYSFGKKKVETINGVKVLRSFEIGRGKSSFKLFLNYSSFALSASLKALFTDNEFDIIFVNQLSPILMCLPAMVSKKKNKLKILLYCLDLWPASLAAGGVRETSIIYKFFLGISIWIYKSVDMILISSSMFKDYFQETLKIDTIRMKHLPQYAEDLFLQTEKEIELELKEKKEKKLYNFVFAGNIGDMQSVDTIIRAANELKDNSDVKFHIIGDGSKLDYCKEISGELNLDNIIFYGKRPISEMPQFYSMADAMLVTLKDNKALSYTLPGKVQSYMAAEKPIIGAINGETKRVIENAKCGFCCEAEDYKGLAQLILQFIDRTDKKELAHNAIEFYRKNYSKEKFISVLEEILISMEA